jgi:starvation-inducible DNA-binding protein
MRWLTRPFPANLKLRSFYMATSTKKPSAASAALTTPTDLGNDARKQVAEGLTRLLADVFSLFVKTKNFHWHVSGPHFRDYHLLLDDQAQFVYDMIDPIAERARKLGGTTLRSVGQISTLKRLADNDADFVPPIDMLNELRADNESLVKYMRELHELCDDKEDVATASLIENWIDQTEERVWFLFEATRS